MTNSYWFPIAFGLAFAAVTSAHEADAYRGGQEVAQSAGTLRAIGAAAENENVVVRLIPLDVPVEILPHGGPIEFTVEVKNTGDVETALDLWLSIGSPGTGSEQNYAVYHLTLARGETKSRALTAAVSGNDPAGTYTLTARAGTFPDVVVASDDFQYEKLITRFVERTGSENPFDGAAIESSPIAFGDLDADGDPDAFLCDLNHCYYFENIGTATAPSFVERVGADNPLDQFAFYLPEMSIVDLDADNDLDVVTGTYWDPSFTYHENVGSPARPLFVVRKGTDNPFADLVVIEESAPTFADLDADGDPDLVSGSNANKIFYFENTGTATAPHFEQRMGIDNPFNGLFAGDSLALVDVDGDGDIDLFGGNGGCQGGGISYLKNLGTAVTPTFVETDAAQNPLAFVDGGCHPSPAFVDIDTDGDVDAFVHSNTVRFFRNETAE